MRMLAGIAQRTTIVLVAVLAIVAMHGGAASAHTCETTPRHPSPSMTAMGHDEVGHHPDHHGQDRHTAQGSSHCATPACGAIVLAPHPHQTAAPVPSLLSDSPQGPPSDAAPSPDPPVPRPLLHL